MERRPLGHHGGHRGKVVVNEYDLGHVARGIGAGRHGNGAVGLLESQHVVDAVARHGHGVLAALERLHELALLLRGHTTKDMVAVHCGIELGRRIERRGVHISVRPGTPTTRAIDDTVRGSSPLITLRVTPCSLK